jgi:hypothetical protein
VPEELKSQEMDAMQKNSIAAANEARQAALGLKPVCLMYS